MLQDAIFIPNYTFTKDKELEQVRAKISLQQENVKTHNVNPQAILTHKRDQKTLLQRWIATIANKIWC